MRFARIEENAMDHPKFIAINASAWRLWCEGNTYCQRQLTDGFIPATAVKGFRYFTAAAQRQLLEALVPNKGPLWERVEGGFMMHHYLDWNDSAEKVLKARKDAKDRLEKWKADQALKRGVTPLSETPTGNALRVGARNASKRNGTEQNSLPEKSPVERRGGAGDRRGVGAGTYPGDHLDHLACGPVCFTPRMTAKFIGRFGSDRGRLEAWAKRVCERETARMEAGQPVTHGDDFAYWTAAYDADFAAPAVGPRSVPGTDSTEAYLARHRAARG